MFLEDLSLCHVSCAVTMRFITNLGLYRKWWQTWHTLPIFSWLKGANLYREGRYREAIRHYQRGLNRYPDHPANVCARLDLAYCYFHMGLMKEAEEELRYTTTRSPDTREAQLRLAQFQLWNGRSLESAWTLKRALKRMEPDQELAATFLMAVLDNGGPCYLLKEAKQVVEKVEQDEGPDDHSRQRLEIAKARLMIFEGQKKEGYTDLYRLASQHEAPIEAIVAVSELLVKEGKIAFARQFLRRGLQLSPTYPRLLGLFAETYLCSGAFYSPDFAVQLASKACQNSLWASPREIHVLAEAYFHAGDRMSALLMASKAKEEGTRLLGAYRDVKSLDKLIESLSGTIS
jgi:tetratricopeptide (TPR) repeat protein